MESFILAKVNNPQFTNEKLDQLEKEPSCYLQHKLFIEISNNPYVLVYCTNYISVLVRKDSPIWNAQILAEIFEWIPDVIQKKAEILFQFQKQFRIVIIDYLCVLYTYILSKLWDTNSQLANFFITIANIIPDSDPHHRELRYSFFAKVINEIQDTQNIYAQKIKTKILADKNDASLFNLFMDVVNSNFQGVLDFSQANTIQASLELLLAILCFYKKKQNSTKSDTDENALYFCDLTLNFKDVLTDANFISTLFSLFNFSKAENSKEIIKNLLKVILEIISVKESYFPNIKDKLSLIVPIVTNLTQLIQMDILRDSDVFLLSSQVIYKLSLLVSNNNVIMNMQDQLFSFLSVLREILAPYLTDTNLFVSNNESIINFIKFWTTIISKNSSIVQFKEMSFPLFQSYIQTLLKSSSELPDEMIEILGLDKYIICEQIKVMPVLLKTDFAALGILLETASRQVFESYKNIIINKRIDNMDQFHACDVQMAIYILIMTVGLSSILTKDNIRKKRRPLDFEEIFFKFIIEVIDFTDQNIPTIFSMNGMFLERAIYLFARSFQRTIFSVFSSESSQEENGQVLINYNKIIKRLVDALYCLHVFTNEKFIFENLKSIQKIYNHLNSLSSSKSKILDHLDSLSVSLTEKAMISAQESQPIENYALLLEVSRNITEGVANGAFQFMSNPEICLNFKKEIPMLMQIVKSIVAKNQEVIKPFLASIEAKFNELASGGENNSTVAVLVFIYQLIGIFSNDTSNESSKPSNGSFLEFFKWAFPNQLTALAKIAPQVSVNPEIASTYLKLWYIFMSQVTIHQKNSSIFKPHSPDSIILFTMVTNVLVSYLQATAATVAQNDLYKEKLKPMKNAMLLMSESLGADYIMFGVFELYNDPTLVNLLTNFISIISGLSIEVILQYPKLSIAYMKLIVALCKNHLMTICNCSLEFFDYLFTAIYAGLREINEEIRDMSIDAGKLMGKFVQSNKTNQVIAESIGRNQAVITQILTIAIDLYLTTNKEYNLLMLINPFLTFLPNYMQNLATTMLPQVPQDGADKYREIFQELIAAATDIFMFDKFKLAMEQLKNFAKIVHLKVPVQ